MTPLKTLDSILVATDLTQGSIEAVRAAADLARASGGKLHIVHAHEEPGITSPGRDILTQQRTVHEKRGALHDFLAEHVPGARFDSARVLMGSAAEVILEESRSLHPDVIVLGAHRNRGVADRFLGSTAELVLRHATVPCLILNGPLNLPVSGIVVPSDFSEPSRRAAATALAWAEVVSNRAAIQVTLAHVLDSSIQVDRAPWTEQEIETDLRVAATEAVKTGTGLVPLGAKVLRGDDPVEQLLTFATQSGAGLIVLGTHGDGILVRALLGSISSAMVRRSPLPILLVPRVAGKRESILSRRAIAAPEVRVSAAM